MDKLQRIYDTLGILEDEIESIIDEMDEKLDDNKADTKEHKRKMSLYFALVEAVKKVGKAGCDIQPFVKKQ